MTESSFGPIISTDDLREHCDDPDWAIVDCRFDLTDTGAGREAYRTAHIPGAVYADLETDLSDMSGTGRGRHPLPTPSALREVFSRLGIGGGTRVIAYDAADGAVAARLWWMLRYMGHDAVAVLNGGWRAWQTAALPERAGDEYRSPAQFRGEPRRDWLVGVDEVSNAALLVDARAPARYRGEMEPLDPVAGHIPGAVNDFYGNSVDESGRFLSGKLVRERLLRVFGDTPPEQVIFYCGSGVTACHNALAAAHAGLPAARVYAGSWSEWCSDPSRPVATGARP